MYLNKRLNLKSYLVLSQSAESLALSRIVVSTMILLFSVPPMEWIMNLAIVHDSFVKPNLIIESAVFLLGDDVLLSESFIRVVYYLIAISGILSVLGCLARYSIPTLAILYTFIVAYLWSFGEVHHPRAVLCWFFIVLAISQRSADVYSLDGYLGFAKLRKEVWQYGWANLMLIILLSSAYCFSGLWKIFYQGGVEWLNGYTLKYYLVSKEQNTLSEFIISKHWLLVFLSYFSIFLEVFFPLAILLRKHSLWFLIGALFFHVGNFLLRGENGIFILWPFIAIGYAYPLDKVLKFKNGLNVVRK